MPVELTYKWWKEHKAKTLLKEPLSDALKEFDKYMEALEKYPTREKLAKVGGALKNVQDAIEETYEKCSELLHGKTITYCEQLRRIAKNAAETVKQQQKEFNEFLKEFQRRREALVEVLQYAQHPRTCTTQSMEKANKETTTMLDWLQTSMKDGAAGSDEIRECMKYLTAMTILLTKLIKNMKSSEDFDDELLELRQTIPKVEKFSDFTCRPAAANEMRFNIQL